MRINNPTIYTRKELEGIDANYVPKRVAIIMDGNRRWAKERGLTKEQGHKAGAKALIDITYPAEDIGIKVMTVYGFSTENWFRSESEVESLLALIQDCMRTEEARAVENQLKLDFLGDIDQFPPALSSLFKHARTLTESHEKVKLVLALNYGARNEIKEAFRRVLQKARANEVRQDQITPELIGSHTQADILEGGVDMVIRTSGEKRVSNFLLWHLKGVEFVDVPTYWPDFNKYHLAEAVRTYQERKLRANGIKK